MSRVLSRDGKAWPAARIVRHVSELVRLAGPVIVARAGILVMAVVDVIFVGRYGTSDLAHLALGSAPFNTLVGTGAGLLIGTLVMTANAFGRGALAECGAVWQRGTIYAGLLGFAGFAICLFGEPILLLLGQTPEMAVGAGRIMIILGLGLPAGLIYTATAYFLEGLKRPVPGMVVMVLANLLNALLVWVLVFGVWIFPEMGAEGAAWASTLVRTFLAAAMVAYVLGVADYARYGVKRWSGWRWREWAKQRRIGYGGGASVFIESGAFMSLSLFAGWIGAVALGAHGIALNLLALIFMVALGVGSATAVRVGIAHGRHDWKDLSLAGWTGLGVNSVVMVLLGIVLWAIPDSIAGLFTTDPALVASVTPLIALSAFILIVDGGQVVMANALRGRGDALVPALMHTISYIVVMVPLSWFLALPLGHGVLGLYEGILIASVVSAALLVGRFQWLCRRDTLRDTMTG